MEKKRLVLLVFVMVLGLGFGLRVNGLAGASDIPLPSDINIIPPATDLPKELTAFSGKWTGTWGGRLDVILIVEQIDQTKAMVVYAWKSKTGLPGFYRRTARVTIGKRPVLEFDGITQATTLEFQMNEDLKSLSGKWAFTGKRMGAKDAYITMERMN